jgi:putative ABC transport system permease protein
MSLWRHLKHGFHGLTRRATADRDVADEVAHYLEETTARLTQEGLSPEDARRAARLEVGNTVALREEVRASGWENAIDTIIADLRYGARWLRKSPGFVAVSALTLGLGIGASTAIFSAVNPVLFEPLPYPNAGRITMIWDTGGDGSGVDVTFGTYRELVARSRSFQSVAVMKGWQPTLVGVSVPERLDGQRVSAAYFRSLGMSPALGRDFTEPDDRHRGPRVVILSDGLWRRRFGADASIVGREIALDDDGYRVIGVMPGTFENVLAPSAEIWAPLQYDPSLPSQGREWGHHLRLIGRRDPATTAEAARRELESIAQTPIAEFPRMPWASLDRGFIVRPLQEEITRGVKPALLSVFGAVIVLLAIACVNVTNLLLARGAQRSGELAMRAALGAGRARLLRQLLTESLLLAALGGALGLIMADVGVQAVLALSPPGLPRASAIHVDGAALAFGAGVTLLVGLVVGIIPALQAWRRDLSTGIRRRSRATASGHQVTRRVLVVVEVALALVLLVSAGLLLRSLQHLFAVPSGFDPANVLTMHVQTSGHRFEDASVTHRFFTDALEAVRAVPGVRAAAFTNQLPLTDDYDVYGVRFESSTPGRADELGGAFRYAVSPGYFEALGLSLRRGRFLNDRDVAGAPLAAVINESLASRRFPGRDAIGERLQIGADSGPWYTVVGIVGDVKQTSLALKQPDAVYMTPTQWQFADNARWLVVRARGDAAGLTPALREAIWSVDKDRPIMRVATMEDRVAASAAERRFALALFEAFGVLALLLAAIGLFGVLSGGVTERTREIGVRAAMGATRGDILALVVRQGLMLTMLGIVVGLAAAVGASMAIATLLFEISPLDPVTYVGVGTLLLGVSALACSVPAWRAVQVDPSVTLRAD